MNKEKKKRKRWTKDLLDMIADGMEKSIKEVTKKIGIDLPEENSKK